MCTTPCQDIELYFGFKKRNRDLSSVASFRDLHEKMTRSILTLNVEAACWLLSYDETNNIDAIHLK